MTGRARRSVGSGVGAVLLVLWSAGAAGAPRDLVGKAAPEFSGRLVSGQSLSLSSFRGKVPVILTFWSIYCKSCTEEMVSLQRLYAKYGPEKVAVIAVNEDGDVGLNRVNLFLERFAATGDAAKLTFPIFFDEKSQVFEKYAVVHMPTLVYIDRDGLVREAIEGFERGREHAVISAIEKLIGTVSPEPLREVAAEAVYELDVVAPICGVYRDGAWYRPLDLDESGRPEAVARARAEGEDFIRREALRLALADIGVVLAGATRLPACGAPYGQEIRTPRREKDPLDILLETLALPRVLEVVSQETIERERDLLLYRKIRIALPSLSDQLAQAGYAIERSTVRLRFVQATVLEERAFVDAVRTRFPFLSDLQKVQSSRAGSEYLLTCQATAERAVEAMRTLDVGPRKLSVDLLPGNIAEVAMWR